MNVLVAYGSKRGSTREIAEAIGEELRASGCTAVVRAAAQLFRDDVPAPFQIDRHRKADQHQPFEYFHEIGRHVRPPGHRIAADKQE